MTAGIRYNKSAGLIQFTAHKEDFKTDHDTSRQETGNTKRQRYRYCEKRAGVEDCWWRERDVPDTAKDALNKRLNREARELNTANTTLNNRNKKRNAGYRNTVSVASHTPKGEYVVRRGLLRTHNTDNQVDNDAKNNIEKAFKDWYKDKKLEVYDDSILETKGKPPYGEFDPVYYANQNTTVKDAWTNAVADDDVDIVDRYKNNENIYYKQHYANIGKGQRKRGNRAEVNEAEKQYTEFALTNDDEAAIRSLHLNIDTENQTDRLLGVPEIAELWTAAKGGDPYWSDLAKEHYLDVYNKDDFAALFRLSDDPGHKEIAFNYQANTGYGITELEDALNEAAGEKGIVDTKKFGALTQNVLKDTIEEMKKAKGREEFLSTVSGFSGFGEIMDVNSSLTNSILGDSGVGGIVSWLGGGKAEEDLEKSLEGVTGVNRNNATYNWQKWYDEKLKTKYDDAMKLGYTVDDVEQEIQIDKEFATKFIDDYLDDRFNQSKSMDEFTEYLDVRQEEQNPFQTQSLLNAIKSVATENANTYMTQLRGELDRKFDADYYWDPASYEGSNVALTEDYANQKRIVQEDWEKATGIRADGTVIEKDPYWAQQAYRFGAIPFDDTTLSEADRKRAFAKVHYAVKGQSYRDAEGNIKPFDAADDIVNPTKVKNYIYENILPELNDEALTQGSVFGKFITPEEFADDVLEGLDPTDKSEWDAVLKQYGLENFQGSFDELKDFILETLRTGSAQKIREQIKFLNEKRKKPTQKILGVSYIEREEDYKDEKPTPDTELYKTFQNAGFQGTEDEFYNDFFPDLDRGEQKLLQKGGENDPLKTFGLDLDDPFASLGTITQFLDEDPTASDDDDDRDKDEKENYFTYDLKKSDTNWSYKPRKKEDQVLGEYTGWFKGL